ncbi:MAG: poly(A) polymerase [Acidimicrobiales bacterium]
MWTVTDFQPLLAALDPVSELFRAGGHELFLVGGMVRDHVLGADLEGDYDLTTDARPERTKQLLAGVADALWTQGERFGTIGARIGRIDLEITTYRAETYADESRKPEVVFGHDLETDLSRRDFTINAMAVSVFDGVLHDPFGGRIDLEHRRLKTPLAAAISFTDDPLRMLRAARFLPRFGLTATVDLSAAAASNADRLSIVSAERIRQEFERLLAVDDPTTGLVFLSEHGLARHVVAGLAPDRWAAATSWVAMAEGVLTRRALMLLELGSVEAKCELERLRYSRRDIAATQRVIDLVPAMASSDGRPPSLRSLVLAAQPHGLELVRTTLSVAEIARSAPARLAEDLKALTEAEDLDRMDVPLSGDEVMAVLGDGPGPRVGRALDHLWQYRVEHGPFDVERAYALLADFSAGYSD